MKSDSKIKDKFMTKKQLCPLCRTRLSNRHCLVRGDEICAKCCGMNRTTIGCDESCSYYKTITTGKDIIEGLPVYKVLKSKTEGSYAIIVMRERPDGRFQYINVLIDAWKMGLKKCFGSHSITMQDFQRQVIVRVGGMKMLKEISLSEAQWAIKYGLRIANEVNIRIPKEFDEFKYILGNIDDIKVNGSLYKCYKCEKGELSDEEVELIKKVTETDMASGTCGTPLESLLFFICDKCK